MYRLSRFFRTYGNQTEITKKRLVGEAQDTKKNIMALINCPNCGRQVSDSAPVCPGCGTPINTTSVKKTFCKYCGSEIQGDIAFCPSCGKPVKALPQQNLQQSNSRQPQQTYQQPAYIQPVYQQPQPQAQQNQTTVIVNGGKSNGIGTAGLILAILAIVFCWVPIVDFVLWGLGALLSFIGLFKSPRGTAIAGFIISFLGIIIIVALAGSIIAMMQ